MDKKIIITIAREYGSGGREIGKKIADKLKIPFYDKELITMAAKESGFKQEMFEKNDEQVDYSNNYLTAIGYVLGSPIAGLTDISMNDELHQIQAKVIRQLAEKGSCVIVGRCANYVLRNDPSRVSLFITGKTEDKVLRVVNDYQTASLEDAEKLMEKTDKRRGNYYNYYTNQDWKDAQHYDLCVNSSVLGIDKTVDLICEFINLKA